MQPYQQVFASRGRSPFRFVTMQCLIKLSLSLLALLLALDVSTVSAFQAATPVTRTAVSASSTELGIFGKKKQPEKEEEKKKEFVFFWDRPQYDWVTGKPAEGGKKMVGKNWLDTSRNDKKKDGK